LSVNQPTQVNTRRYKVITFTKVPNLFVNSHTLFWLGEYVTSVVYSKKRKEKYIKP